MSEEVTLELVEAKQTELAALIEQLRTKSKVTLIKIPALEIELLPGEWYAGAVLNEDGSVKHHTIAASVGDDRNFADTQAWAAGLGYSAPTKQEARLIVAHHFGRLDGRGWFWTCEEDEGDSSFAWNCGLSYGVVSINDRSARGAALAVRRLVP